MAKPDVIRWLDLEPGDSIIEHITRADAVRLAVAMAKQGMLFKVESLPVEKPILITRVE